MGFENFNEVPPVQNDENMEKEKVSFEETLQEFIKTANYEDFLKHPDVSGLEDRGKVKHILEGSVNPMYLKEDGLFESLNMEDIADIMIEKGDIHGLHQSFTLGKCDEFNIDKNKKIISMLIGTKDESIVNDPFIKKLVDLGFGSDDSTVYDSLVDAGFGEKAHVLSAGNM